MGELLAVVSTTLFSLANISIGRTYRGTAARGGAFLSMLMTFGLSFVVWLALGLHGDFTTPSQAAIGWFVLAGVLTAFVGRVFLFESIRYLGAVKGSAIKRLNPMFSVILGVLLLGEVISVPMTIGIALIAASFVVLIRQSLHADTEQTASASKRSTLGRIVNLGYLHGPISAFAYASGYVARKQGLLVTPDAVLGTMIGAVSGITCFCLLASVVTTMRAELHRTFTEFRPWLWLAGLFTSFGQLMYFAALRYTSISKIALITSMEVFVTMFLTRIMLSGDEPLPRDVVVAACLGVLGTVLVIRY
jgi:drug/metabolite transporter (DMT)-like permease